jgi:hypothetical protein
MSWPAQNSGADGTNSPSAPSADVVTKLLGVGCGEFNTSVPTDDQALADPTSSDNRNEPAETVSAAALLLRS